jgi:hypothetical protein
VPGLLQSPLSALTYLFLTKHYEDGTITFPFYRWSISKKEFKKTI